MSAKETALTAALGPIGVIGLGNMGLAMAANLFKSGFDVIGTDLIAEYRDALNRVGGDGGRRCTRRGKALSSVKHKRFKLFNKS